MGVGSAKVNPLRKQMPDQFSLLGQLNMTFATVTGQLMELRAFQRQKGSLPWPLPFQPSLLVPDNESQIGVALTGGPRQGPLGAQVAERLLPFFNFFRPLPAGQTFLDAVQIRNGRHERRDGGLLLLGGVGYVKPELMLISRHRGPDVQGVPAVTAQAQSHLLEVPMGDMPVLDAALENRLDLAHEPALLALGARPPPSRRRGNAPAPVAPSRSAMLGQQRAHGGEHMFAVNFLRTRTLPRPPVFRIVPQPDFMRLAVFHHGGVSQPRLIGAQIVHVPVAEMGFALPPDLRPESFQEDLRVARIQQLEGIVHLARIYMNARRGDKLVERPVPPI